MGLRLQGPGCAPESPMPRVQAALSTQMALSLTAWPEVPCTGSGPLCCLLDEGAKDGWIAAGHLLCGNTKPRPLLRAGALGAPMRKPVGPQVCTQGKLMGRVLAASQRAQDVPSQDSESIWVGSLSTASLSATVPLPFGGRKPSLVTQALLCKARRPVLLSPRPPLLSGLPSPSPAPPPPTCSPEALRRLPLVIVQGMPLRSLFPDRQGGEGHVLTQT